MNRTRLSTTVDTDLLASARALGLGPTDASLIDAAMTALLHQHRRAEIDAAYAAYDTQPMAEQDAWGDLASWRVAASAS